MFTNKYFNEKKKPFHYSIFYSDKSNLTIENWHKSLKNKIEDNEEDIWLGNILYNKQIIVISFGSLDMFFRFTDISNDEINDLKNIYGQHTINWQSKIELWLDTEYEEDLLQLSSMDFPEINEVLELTNDFNETQIYKH